MKHHLIAPSLIRHQCNKRVLTSANRLPTSDKKIKKLIGLFYPFCLLRRGTERIGQWSRRREFIAVIDRATDGLISLFLRTSAGIRTQVYRVKACRDNHLHYKEPLDESSQRSCVL